MTATCLKLQNKAQISYKEQITNLYFQVRNKSFCAPQNGFLIYFTKILPKIVEKYVVSVEENHVVLNHSMT